MTIKQLHEMTKHSTKIAYEWGDSMRELDRDNDLMIDAYGPYVIERLTAEYDTIIATLKAIPVRENDN